MKNYGLNLEREEQEQDGSEWKFGGESPVCTFSVPLDVRFSYLPKGELQRGVDDFMDCVTRGYLNILETKFNYAYRNNLISEENRKWLGDNKYLVWYKEQPYIEFSDRFIAMKSNTNRSGNSMKAPAQAIHEYGLIPKSILPADSGMTFDAYHNRNDITIEMERLGKEFLTRFPLFYEQVSSTDLDTLLLTDCLNLAGHAWPTPKGGEYARNNGTINHAFMGFELPKTFVFDNYIDVSDGDWIKKLAEDYNLYPYGYRVYIGEDVVKKTIWDRVLIFLRRLWVRNFGSDRDRIQKMITDILAMIARLQTLLRNQTVYETAFNHLGTDASPNDLAPDELGCAESVTTILRKHVRIPIILGTYTLYRELERNPAFRKVTIPMPGNIIISPTGMSSLGRQAPFVGHVGIVGENNMVMANNSETGKWDEIYTIDSWKKRWGGKGGYPVDIFALT